MNPIELALLLIPLAAAIVLAIISHQWTLRQINLLLDIHRDRRSRIPHIYPVLNSIINKDEATLFSEFVFVGIANSLILFFTNNMIEVGLIYTFIWILLIVIGFNSISLERYRLRNWITRFILFDYLFLIGMYITFSYPFNAQLFVGSLLGIIAMYLSPLIEAPIVDDLDFP